MVLTTVPKTEADISSDEELVRRALLRDEA
jgi:hypothetical protein